jgi:hypothetical protein
MANMATAVRARDRLIQRRAVGQPQAAGQRDLHQRPGVRLLRVVKLVPAVPAGMLAVQQPAQEMTT